MKDASTELIARIHSRDAAIEVGESADNPDWLEIRNPDQKSVDYFGKFAFSMPADFALELGNALVRLATLKVRK